MLKNLCLWPFIENVHALCFTYHRSLLLRRLIRFTLILLLIATKAKIACSTELRCRCGFCHILSCKRADLSSHQIMFTRWIVVKIGAYLRLRPFKFFSSRQCHQINALLVPLISATRHEMALFSCVHIRVNLSTYILHTSLLFVKSISPDRCYCPFRRHFEKLLVFLWNENFALLVIQSFFANASMHWWSDHGVIHTRTSFGSIEDATARHSKAFFVLSVWLIELWTQ